MTVNTCSEHPAQKTVLIVDDEEMVRRSAKRMLSRIDCCSLLAATGDDAVEVFVQNKDTIDVVLLDMGLPGMAGKEVLERLKEVDRNVKVVIATGNVHGADVDALIAQGAAAYLGKPYSLHDLKDTFDAL